MELTKIVPAKGKLIIQQVEPMVPSCIEHASSLAAMNSTTLHNNVVTDGLSFGKIIVNSLERQLEDVSDFSNRGIGGLGLKGTFSVGSIVAYYTDSLATAKFDEFEIFIIDEAAVLFAAEFQTGSKE